MLACFPLDLGAAFFALVDFSPPAGFPLSVAAFPSAALFSKPPPPFLAFLASGGGTSRVWFVLAGCSGSCEGVIDQSHGENEIQSLLRARSQRVR